MFFLTFIIHQQTNASCAGQTGTSIPHCANAERWAKFLKTLFMARNSIDGKWTGQVTYNNTYPKAYRNKVLSFVLYLSSVDGFITGTCEDDITKELLLKPAEIEGTSR